MKLQFGKAAAVVALAAAATFTPIAAHAYPSASDIAVSSPTVAPGDAVTVTTIPGTFEPGEPISISLTGENASGGSLGLVKFVVETQNLGTVTANADGSSSAVVRLPANATGSYTITKTSDSLPAGISTTVTIAAAGGGNNAGGLPATGMDSSSLLGLWVGGGALVLAGGAVAVGAAVHRQRKQAA